MGFSFGLLAFAVAAVYLKVTPEEVSTASGVQRIILAYGHSLCWALLGTASFLWGASKEARLLAYAALAAYQTLRSVAARLPSIISYNLSQTSLLVPVSLSW